jgi:hypothetical protein
MLWVFDPYCCYPSSRWIYASGSEEKWMMANGICDEFDRFFRKKFQFQMKGEMTFAHETPYPMHAWLWSSSIHSNTVRINGYHRHACPFRFQSGNAAQIVSSWDSTVCYWVIYLQFLFDFGCYSCFVDCSYVVLTDFTGSSIELRLMEGKVSILHKWWQHLIFIVPIIVEHEYVHQTQKKWTMKSLTKRKRDHRSTRKSSN